MHTSEVIILNIVFDRTQENVTSKLKYFVQTK